MKQTLILDSTKLSSFFECSELYNLQYAQSLVQINSLDPSLTHRVPDKIAVGTLGHKYQEIYYRALGRDLTPSEAARVALDFDPDKADTIDNEFPLSRELRAKCRRRFIEYLMHYSGSDYTVGTTPRHTVSAEGNLLRDVFVPEPLVERGFSYPLLDTAEYLFVLEGKIDFIGSTYGETLWMDHKWQLRARELYKKSIQFRNYALATGLPLGCINYVRLHDKVSRDTFIRQPISFSAAEMYAWKQELTEMFITVAKETALGRTVWTQNRASCSGKFGYPCTYTPLCEIYNPQQREIHKRVFFTKGKEWRPW